VKIRQVRAELFRTDRQTWQSYFTNAPENAKSYVITNYYI